MYELYVSWRASLAVQPEQLQPAVRVSHHVAATAAGHGRHRRLPAAAKHHRHVAAVEVHLQRTAGSAMLKTARKSHTSHITHLDDASIRTPRQHVAAAHQLPRVSASGCQRVRCLTCTALTAPRCRLVLPSALPARHV
jgi:hypothetical protein